MNFIIHFIKRLLGIKPKYVPSAVMQEFYWAMQAWVEQGLYTDSYFQKNSGLCHNLSAWARSKSISWEKIAELDEELKDSFSSQGLSTVYPFNKSFPDLYNECELWCAYENPKRLAWIEKYAA